MNDVLNTKYGTAKVIGGYYIITSRETGNHGKLLHRLIFEDYYNIKLPSHIDIHHDDGDKLNNNMWNLIPLTRSEHMSLHQKHRHKESSKIIPMETRIKISENQNITGYFRVHKHTEPTCKQGFYYQYRWYENGKENAISRVDINKLKEEVIKRGLEWIEYSN